MTQAKPASVEERMAHASEFNRASNIIELVVTGRFTAEDARDVTSKATALTKEHGVTDVLCDLSGVVELALILADLFNLPDRQYAEEGVSRRVRMALVVPRLPEHGEAMQFWQTACLNRGWQAQLFPNRADAAAWLTGDDSAHKPDAGRGS